MIALCLDRRVGVLVSLMPLSALGLACGGADELEVFFQDPVVEAAARTVDLNVLSAGPNCDVVLGRTFEENTRTPGLVRVSTFGYPVRSQDDALAELPEKQALVLEVRVNDAAGAQIARACQVVSLGSSMSGVVRMEARTLPACVEPPTRLDVLIALDTSSALARASVSASGDHVEAIRDVIMDPVGALPETRWSVLGFGAKTTDVTLPILQGPTTELTVARRALTEAKGQSSGNPRLFEAMAVGAQALRARAVCGRRAVLFLVAAGADLGSKISPEEARISVFSTVGDTSDDVAVLGLAFSSAAYADIDAVLPTDAGVTLRAVVSREQLTSELAQLRSALFNLLAPPN